MKFIEYSKAPIGNWRSKEVPDDNYLEVKSWCEQHTSDGSFTMYCTMPLRVKANYTPKGLMYAEFYFEKEEDRNWFILRWT